MFRNYFFVIFYLQTLSIYCTPSIIPRKKLRCYLWSGTYTPMDHKTQNTVENYLYSFSFVSICVFGWQIFWGRLKYINLQFYLYVCSCCRWWFPLIFFYLTSDLNEKAIGQRSAKKEKISFPCCYFRNNCRVRVYWRNVNFRYFGLCTYLYLTFDRFQELPKDKVYYRARAK